MGIDVSKLNLSEKDIEDWIYDNPDVIYGTFGKATISRWFGRQYSLPSGIADLIGVRDDEGLVVIEVKNVPINKAAILQVCRYAYDLEEIAAFRMGYPHTQNFERPYVERVVVGPSIDAQTLIEATAVDVRVWQFAITINVEVSRLYRNQQEQSEMESKLESLARRTEWQVFGKHASDAYREDAIKRTEQERQRIVAARKATEPSVFDDFLETISTD